MDGVVVNIVIILAVDPGSTSDYRKILFFVLFLFFRFVFSFFLRCKAEMFPSCTLSIKKVF